MSEGDASYGPELDAMYQAFQAWLRSPEPGTLARFNDAQGALDATLRARQAAGLQIFPRRRRGVDLDRVSIWRHGKLTGTRTPAQWWP